MDALFLNHSDQAFYVGFRNAAYKIAWLTGQGALVILAGVVAEGMGFGFHDGWAASFATCALLFVAAAVFHSIVLPKPQQDSANVNKSDSAAKQLTSQFSQVFKTFFTQPGSIAIVPYGDIDLSVWKQTPSDAQNDGSFYSRCAFGGRIGNQHDCGRHHLWDGGNDSAFDRRHYRKLCRISSPD